MPELNAEEQAKAAADKAAADKAAADKAAADAAKAVVVAKAVVSKRCEISSCGVTARGSFAAYGRFSGVQKGEVTVDGFQVNPTALRETVVKGSTPVGLAIGEEVVVVIADASIKVKVS